MAKHYSIEFKHRIVKLILEQHWGVREAAEAFNMPSHTSVLWLQRFEKYGINGLHRQSFKPRKPRMPKTKPLFQADNPQNIKALLKELKYLRAENAVLKKLKELDERKLKKRNRQPIKKTARTLVIIAYHRIAPFNLLLSCKKQR